MGRPMPSEAAPAPEPAAPWSRAERLYLLALALVCGLTLLRTVHPFYDHANDAATYVLTTRALLAGDGYTYLSIPMIVRPPGFSALLLPVLALCGESFLAMNLYVALFGVAAVLLLFVLARPRLGGLPAFAAALLVWSNPFFQRTSAQVLSDVPGLALLLACLWLDRACRHRPSLARHALLGLVLALTIHVRTLLGVLIPALVLARLFAQRWPSHGERPAPRRGTLGYLACVVLIPLAAQLPWIRHVARAEVPAPAEQLYVHSYWTAMWHEDAADPSSPRVAAETVLARVPGQLREALHVVGARMNQRSERGLPALLGLLGLAAWLVQLARRRGPEEWFVAGTLAALAIFYALPPRLVLPVWVLWVPALAELALDVTRRLLPRRAAAPAVALVLVALAAVDFKPWTWQEAAGERHRARRELAGYLETIAKPDQSFAAPIGWHYGVFLRQPVYSLQIRVANERRPELAAELLDLHDVRAVIFNAKTGSAKAPPAALMARLRKKREVGPYHVYVVRGTRSR